MRFSFKNKFIMIINCIIIKCFYVHIKFFCFICNNMKCLNDYIVNVKNLKKNAFNIRKQLAEKSKFCAIVKADAYGLGSEIVCKSLYGIADFFGVACLKEAMDIRSFDKITPIVILGMTTIEDLEICSKNNISISVTSIEQLRKIQKCNKKIKIHLQINTGLNRFGIRKLTDFKKVLKIIDNDDNLVLEGLYSHFATKEKDRLFINIQFFKFLQFKNYVKNREVICHIANSYATILSAKYHLDMVRNGFSLYVGKSEIGNHDVLSIHSQVVNILNLKKGDTVGYDRTFSAKNRMKIAVIPIGYADGMDRKLSNNFSVIVNDQKCPIVGLICMDVFMVDITGRDVSIGDRVVILGSSKTHKLTIFDYAKVLDTSPYEILLKFNHKRMNYIINI